MSNLSEEEKKAIEYIESGIGTYIENTKVSKIVISEEQAKILLNLIEKQQEINQVHQKINGELRIKVKELEKLLEEKTLRIGFENSDDYVSKDKIKEKLRELDRMRKNTITDEAFNIFTGEIVVLNQLLED